MHVEIPVAPWAGSHRVELDEAVMLVHEDGFRPTDLGGEYDPAGYAAFPVVLGGVEVGCTSWGLGVEGPFVVLTLEGVIRRDWDAFVEQHTLDGLLQGSGRIELNSETGQLETMWAYPASRLLVAPTSFAFVESAVPA